MTNEQRIAEIKARCDDGRLIRRIDIKYLLSQLAERNEEIERLTLEELRQMDGEPVFAVDGEGHRCWVLVNADDECCADNEFGSWQFFYYGMTDCAKDRLHPTGWLAYRSKPKEDKNG